MKSSTSSEAFGPASECSSLAEAIELIRSNSGQGARSLAAAHGMALHALQAVRDTHYFEDTRFVLDELSRAKAELDIAAWHGGDVTSTTAAILLAAQSYVDEEIIGCHEWPLPEEVAELVLNTARKLAAA